MPSEETVNYYGEFAIHMLPVVMLSYPRNPSDPIYCLNGALVNRLANCLREHGFSAFHISMPGDVDAYALADLELDGWEIDFSEAAYPQHRLQELFARHSWEQAVVLTSYSQFIDIPSLEKCISLCKGKELVACVPQSPPSSFWVMGKGLVAKLGNSREAPITPFQFCEVAGHILEDALVAIPTACSRYGRYLNMVYGYVKQPGNGFPLHAFVEGYHGFCETYGLMPFSDMNVIKYLHEVSDGRIDTEIAHKSNNAIAAIYPPSNKTDSAFSLLGFILRYQHLLPAPLESFLELGFGLSPITAFFLSQFAEKSYAVEPITHKSDRREETAILLTSLLQVTAYLPSTFHRKRRTDWSISDLVIVDGYIEDVTIPDNSLQFCFSITVLEHVFPFEELAATLFAKLKSGGSMLHLVDFKDHGKLHPFEFYKFSRDEWIAKDEVTNLLRVSDMEKIFKKTGFSVSILDKVCIQDLPQAVSPFWSAYTEEDLTTAGCVFYLVKP